MSLKIVNKTVRQFAAQRAWLALAFLCQATPAFAVTATTPIEHLIVVVGENRSFDNLFGVYQPAAGQQISNLLSRSIVTLDGSPGPNFSAATQRRALGFDRYSPTPMVSEAYKQLPRLHYSGVTGKKSAAIDPRFPADLPNGPFQISRYAKPDTATGDPVHRFFQMWQQVNGGLNDLFVWTGETAGSWSDKQHKVRATNQGGVAMGFYNLSAGDLPYFRNLADNYALADNYHQSVMGGTTANYFALASADMAYYTEGGQVAVPPLRQIGNPDPRAGTNNGFSNDGQGRGVYVQCADPAQPGVAAIRQLLKRLPYPAFNDGNCAPGNYYLVNNLDPGFSPTGQSLPVTADDFHLSPQSLPNIGESLSAAGIGWHWYSGGRKLGIDASRDYCATCDPLTSFTSIMTGKDRTRLLDLGRFFTDAQDAASFPAVAFIAPNDGGSGHAGYSTIAQFEKLVQDIVERVQSNPDLWKSTAILVTFDEGGGYYDSGYVQAIDFFGDGTRVPMLAISPYARHGRIDHNYYDHASVIKFINRNWGLAPLSQRSRDNLPNPVADPRDPYVPLNRPAVGDLMNLFDFSTKR